MSDDAEPIKVVDDILEFDDSDGKYVQDGDGSNVYGDYVVKNRYEKDGHRYMLSMTTPTGYNGNTVSVIQLGNPTLLWIADWTCSRIGIKPFIPPSTNTDPNWVLLDEHLEPEMLVLMPDGVTPVYRISGTYVYAHLNPAAALNRNVNFGRPPWMEDVFDRTVPDSMYQNSIINTTTPQQTGGLENGVVFPGSP